MQHSTRAIRGLSILAGGALVVCQIRLNLEAVGADLTSGIALAAMALPAAMVLAMVVFERRLEARQYGSATLAGLVLLAGIAHTLTVALERGVHAREQLAAVRSAPNAVRDVAEKAHAAAVARLRDLEVAEAKPCRTMARDGSPTRECAAARSQTAAARATVHAEAQKLAVVVPAAKLDGMHARYGALADLIDDWHPVLLPLALELGGLVLVGFGLAGGRGPAVSAEAVAPALPGPEVAPIALRSEPVERLSIRAEARQTGRSKSAVHRERQKSAA